MTPTEAQKRLVIVGATGMFGGYALRCALDHPAVGTATAIGRTPTGLTHPKLNEVLHQDFADCSALAGALSGQDATVLCSGRLHWRGGGRGSPQDHGGLHDRVCSSAPRQQPQHVSVSDEEHNVFKPDAAVGPTRSIEIPFYHGTHLVGVCSGATGIRSVPAFTR
jgi:uncharacterized protein YbjT (DUF2867 family)